MHRPKSPGFDKLIKNFHWKEPVFKIKKSQSQSQKKVKLKSRTKVKKKSKKVNSQQKVKKVKQKLCIGKQVKEKLVTMQIAAFLPMAYGFQLLLKFWGRLLPGPGFGLAAAGSWRRGQVEVELRQATGGLGHAGLGRQKKVKKKSIGKVKKESNVRILALADYWRQQKVKKK